MALSDRVAVLRKGKYIGTVNTADTDPQKLTEMMVGRAVSLNIDRPEVEYGDLRLEVKGLTCQDGEGVTALDNVTFRPTAARSWASPVSPAPARRSCWRPSPGSSPRESGGVSIRPTPERHRGKHVP
ncbi:MAG: hypothetical protein ACLRWQ_01580 [Flavonifractor plautii]